MLHLRQPKRERGGLCVCVCGRFVHGYWWYKRIKGAQLSLKPNLAWIPPALVVEVFQGSVPLAGRQVASWIRQGRIHLLYWR